jgi:hypothetical protein
MEKCLFNLKMEFIFKFIELGSKHLSSVEMGQEILSLEWSWGHKEVLKNKISEQWKGCFF